MTPEELEEYKRRVQERLRAAGVEVPEPPPTTGASPAQPRRQTVSERAADLLTRVRQKEAELRDEVLLADPLKNYTGQPPATAEATEPTAPATKPKAPASPGQPVTLMQGKGPTIPRQQVRKEGMTDWVGRPKGPTPMKFAQDIAFARLDKEARKRTGGALGLMPSEDQVALSREVAESALRDVQAIVGHSDQRGNLITPVDPDKLLPAAKEGDTWLGWLTGQKAVRAIGLTTPEWYDNTLAPFHALAQPGYQGDKTASPQREGKFWWFMRAWSPFSTTLGATLLNPEWRSGDTYEQATEKGAERVLQGYDLTQDWRQIGRLAERLPVIGPIVEAAVPEPMQDLGGLMATGAIIWLEPDASLLLGPAAAGVRRVGRSIDLLDMAVRPALGALGEMKSALTAGKAFHELPEMFPQGTIGRRVAEHVLAMASGTAAEDGLKAADKVRSNLSGLEEELAKMAARAEDAETAADAAARKARVGKVLMGVKDLAERDELLAKALAEAVSSDDILRAITDEGWNAALKSTDAAKDALARVEKTIADASNKVGGGGDEVVGFKTEHGSTYTVGAGGSTTRNKAARAWHPGDSGPKPASEMTIYTDHLTSREIGMFSMLQGARQKFVRVRGDGRIELITQRANGSWGKGRFVDGASGRIVSKTPQVGLHPVEFWKLQTYGDGWMASGWHPGSRIIEVTTGGAAQPPPPRSSRTTLRNLADEVPADEPGARPIDAEVEFLNAGDPRRRALLGEAWDDPDGLVPAGVETVGDVLDRVRPPSKPGLKRAPGASVEGFAGPGEHYVRVRDVEGMGWLLDSPIAAKAYERADDLADADELWDYLSSIGADIEGGVVRAQDVLDALYEAAVRAGLKGTDLRDVLAEGRAALREYLQANPGAGGVAKARIREILNITGVEAGVDAAGQAIVQARKRVAPPPKPETPRQSAPVPPAGITPVRRLTRETDQRVINLMRLRSALLELLSKSARAAPARALLKELEANGAAIKSATAAARAAGAPEKMVKAALKNKDKVSQLAADAAKGSAEAVEKLKDALKQVDVGQKMGERVASQIEKMESSINAFRRMAKGSREVGTFDPKKGVFKLADQPGEFRAAARARYGPAADPLIAAAESGVRGRKLLEAEEAAFMAAEAARLRPIAPAKALVEGHVLSGRVLQAKDIATGALRLAAVWNRFFSPVGGMERLPKFFREAVRRHVNRAASSEIELDKLAKSGDPGAILDYLLTNKVMKDGDGVALVGNLQGPPPLQRAIEYLRGLPKEALASDPVAQAITRAWLATGQAPVNSGEIGQALKALRKFLKSGGDAPAFKEWFNKDLKGIFLRGLNRADDENRALMFLARAAVHGASRYDLMYDWARGTSGLNLSAEAVTAFNFLQQPSNNSINGLRNAVGAMDAAIEASAFFREPILQTALAAGEANARAHGLLRLAIDRMDTGYIPGFLWERINAAPRALAKEIEQFHGAEDGPASWGGKALHAYANMWRLSAIHAWFIPRARFFSMTEVGDWSQIAQNVGFRAATSATAQNLVSNVPFIGRKLGDAMSRTASERTWFAAFMDPQIAHIMAGEPNVIIRGAPEGDMSALDMMRDAMEEGALDSMSSGAMHEFGQRIKTTSTARRIFDAIMNLSPSQGVEAVRRGASDLSDAASAGRLGKQLVQEGRGVLREAGLNFLDPAALKSGDVVPSAFVRASAEMFEAVQHRKRVAFFAKARTGALTGTPMSKAEAGELMRSTLYDYRTGVGEIEMNTIGHFAAFWVYRRNMWRMLGETLFEPFTTPTTEYMGKALANNTRLQRMVNAMQTGALGQDVYAFDGDDEYLLPREHIDAIGRAVAPWWVDAQYWLGNLPLERDSDRRNWYKTMRGTEAPFEAVVFSGLGWLDQMHTLNVIAQTGAALTAGLAYEAGIQTNVTPVQANEIAEMQIDYWTDMLMPHWKAALEGGMRYQSGTEEKRSPEGVVVESGYQVMFQRMPWLGEMMGGVRDAKGRWRIPMTPYSMVAGLTMALPPVQDMARTWAVFDNPSLNESVGEWVTESTWRWASPIQRNPHNPLRDIQKDVEDKARELKHLRWKETKR